MGQQKPTAKPRVRSALRRQAALDRAKAALLSEGEAATVPDADGMTSRHWHALRLRGLDRFAYRQIADAIGVSVTQARRYVVEGMQRLDAIGAETAAEVRSLDLAMIDELQSVFMEKARTGNVSAATLIIKLQLRRDRLLGLSVPIGGASDNEDEVDMINFVPVVKREPADADPGLSEDLEAMVKANAG